MHNATLHGDSLLRALSEVALETQKARSVADVLSVAGAGLEAIGFLVVMTDYDGSTTGLVYASAEPAFRSMLASLGYTPGRRQPQSAASVMPLVARDEKTIFVEDARALANATFGKVPDGMLDKGLAAMPQRLPMLVAPLNVRGAGWGALTLLHAELHEDDSDLINLFALQLGSAIEVASAMETLEQRNAELELVYQLTRAGTRADSAVLTARALEVVCRSTKSDAGAMHRFDEASRRYVLMGEPFGYQGPLSEKYKTINERLDPRFGTGPVAFAASSMPQTVAVQEAGFSQVAAVPLALEGSTVGVLWLARREDEPYSSTQVRSAEILGVQMASYLERIRLYDDLKRSYDELGRTQHELVRHERLAALGELAAVMAHEVRNPLGVIFNSLITLKRLLKPTGDVEMLLSMVGEESDRLNRIVSDLLDFVRPFDVARRPVAIGPIIDGAIDATVKSAEASQVRITREVPDTLPPFPVDAQLLRQALVNLLVNAVQAMPRGGALKVLAEVEKRPQGAWLSVSVRDEGVGLAPGSVERIFQPFFTTKATGTGLGLAVVKRIVDAHQGEIQAVANEGAGATFTIKVPGSEGREAVKTPSWAASARPGSP